MKLAQHLKLLQGRQLITKELADITLCVEQRLHHYWRVDVNTKQVKMALVHLAMALGRIKRGYAAQPLHKDIYAEIKSAVCFSQVLIIHRDVLSFIPFDIPESEQTHLIANWYSFILAQPWISFTPLSPTE
ncbi:hypothetical protein RYD26_01010 [Pasteurellaceae bacterium LIM206]|nr:hypothetical protein [Pasteurellaceae bacterium LIM206]